MVRLIMVNQKQRAKGNEKKDNGNKYLFIILEEVVRTNIGDVKNGSNRKPFNGFYR